SSQPKCIQFTSDDRKEVHFADFVGSSLAAAPGLSNCSWSIFVDTDYSSVHLQKVIRDHFGDIQIQLHSLDNTTLSFTEPNSVVVVQKSQCHVNVIHGDAEALGLFEEHMMKFRGNRVFRDFIFYHSR